MRVLIHLPHAVSAFEPTSEQIERFCQRLPSLTLTVAPDSQSFERHLPEAELAIVWRFDADWYAAAPALKWVATPAAGREGIAVAPSGQCRVTHGSFHGAIMAESLLAMVLFMNRRLGVAVDAQKRRTWARESYSGSRPLRGQTACILGYGAIGRHVGALLQAVGVSVSGLKRDVGVGVQGLDRVYAPHQLNEAVAAADHVVCILPGDTGTQGLLGAPAFERMKPTACVYNLGRGGAIDHKALVQALAQGAIAGAFLDVLAEEPLAPGSPLWSVPNLYLTPHASAIRADYLDLFFDELAQLLTEAPRPG